MIEKLCIGIFFLGVISCAQVSTPVPSGNAEIIRFVLHFYLYTYKRELSYHGDISIVEPYLSTDLYQKFAKLRHLVGLLDKQNDHILLATRVHNIDFFYGYSITPDRFLVRNVSYRKGRYTAHVQISWSDKVNKNMNIKSAEIDVIIGEADAKYAIENVVFYSVGKRNGDLRDLLSKVIKVLGKRASLEMGLQRKCD